ncbi:MAG: iron donor protein CyaY [Planctomycetes bacterium]|nr:iron donor protein CyaY [Planctomycetota bacterium]
MPAPDEQDFLTRAETTMRAVLTALDSFDPDELEADLAGGVLRITFADGRSCIMNRQSAANQLWLAEGATAWHFEYAPASGSWMDTKGRGELRAVLGEVLSRRLKRPVTV